MKNQKTKANNGKRQRRLPPATCSAASASIIEIYGVVVGCDADEQTITAQIPMRPSGVGCAGETATTARRLGGGDKTGDCEYVSLPATEDAERRAEWRERKTMSNPDVTDPPKTPTASTPTSGSVTPQRVGDDWMEYLDSTGNISRYDGMCDCYVCRQIKADYFPWKARKEEAKSLNAEVSGGASGRAARDSGTDSANGGWLRRFVRNSDKQI